MDELLKLRGRHAEYEKRYRELDIMASADITAGRDCLDPFADPVTTIKIDEGKAIVERLWCTIHEMLELEKKLVNIKAALGGAE